MNVTDMTPEQLGKIVTAEANQMLAEKAVYPGMEVRHVKSKRDYTVVCVATIEETMTMAVVYRAAKDHKVWVRALDQFCDGRFVGR